MNRFRKFLSCFIVFSILISSSFSSFASARYNGSAHSDNQKVIVYDNGIKINGIFYTRDEFKKLLEKAKELPVIQPRSALVVSAVAGSYMVPGVGQVLITATGAVLLAGVAIKVGTWAADETIKFFKEHTKNKRKSTHDKHTKPRPGRDSEKKKDPDKGWFPRKDKRKS